MCQRGDPARHGSLSGSGDLGEAQRIIEEDDILDAMSIELEERCYQVLALQQPMASATSVR